MRKVLLYILLFTPVALNAGNNDDIFAKANAAYKNAQYDTAVKLYKQIILNGYESAELYFNLGNTYYKDKDIANAILYFERAKKLNPGDNDINFNLQLAQTMIVDKINVLPEFFLKRWWREFSELFSSDQWAIISVSTFLTFLVSFFVYLFSNQVWARKSFFWLGVVLLVCSVVSFSNSYRLYDVAHNHSGAIVMSPSVTLKSSPDDAGNDLFVIHEGTKVWITDEVADWQEIRIADGNKGWLKKADIEKI